MVQQEATDKTMVFTEDLFFSVKSPEGCSHQGSLLERVDYIHVCSMRQVKGQQLWDTQSGDSV